MFNAFTQFIESSFEFISSRLLFVLEYPLMSNQRIFWLYMLSSTILAFYVFYLSIQLSPPHKSLFRAFIRFLLPKHVWLNPSAHHHIHHCCHPEHKVDN